MASPELEHLLECSNNREDSRLTVTRYASLGLSWSISNHQLSYMPPESIYISEVKKTYESSSSHDLQQALPSSQLGIKFF